MTYTCTPVQGTLLDGWLYACWTSHSKYLISYRRHRWLVKGCKISGASVWPLSMKETFLCFICCDTGQGFCSIIRETFPIKSRCTGILMTCPYLNPRIPTDAFLFPIKIHSYYIHDFQENGMMLHYLIVLYPWIQSQYGVLKLTISGLLPLQLLHT